MGDWRNDKVTEKQLAYIMEMHEFSFYPLPAFRGTTKGEASDYIDKYSKLAHDSGADLFHPNAGDSV